MIPKSCQLESHLQQFEDLPSDVYRVMYGKGGLDEFRRF